MVEIALKGVPDTACKEVRFFCDYWLGLKAEAPLPPCELLDPLDFFSYASRVFILEGRSIGELQVRLAGTIYRELYGFEVTGKRVTELIPFDDRDDISSSYARCIEEQIPIYDVNKMTWRSRGSEVQFERILLPFGDKQGVERILGFAQFFDSDGKKIFT
ncbi:MAG: PAS domain-containing protein [Kiloniellaceae bacterium]